MLFGLKANAPQDPAAVAAAHGRLQTTLKQDPRLPSLQPGALTLAGLDAPTPQASGNGQPAPAAQPAEAFQWGARGERLSPDDIAARGKIAQQQMAAGMDYSPVGHWTQGLARVAQALIGGMEQRKLNKASEENASYEQQILRSLIPSGTGTGTGTGAGTAASNGPALIAAMADKRLSDTTRDAIKLQYQAQNRTPAPPHYFETNNGSQGMIGADGKPVIVYQDPDPKVNWVPDGMGGGNWVAIPSLGTSGGGAPAAGMASPVPTAPVGRITPIDGGAPSQGARTFPVR